MNFKARFGAHTGSRAYIKVLMPLTQSFALPVEMPFDWQSLLAFLRARAAPGVESVSNSAYERTCGMNETVHKVHITHDPASAELQIRVTGDPGDQDSIKANVRGLFKTNVNTGTIEAFLSGDLWLNGYIGRQPGLRVPGGWHPFEVAARAVLGQQISVAAATTLMGRLVAAAGVRVSDKDWVFPSPQQVLESDLGNLGIPAKRSETLRAVAAMFVKHGDDLLHRADAWDHLLVISGIGRWTAGYILMRVSQTTDYWPEGDLVLRKALSPNKGLLAPARLSEAFKRWSPYRSYATIHIWRGYVSSANSTARQS